MHKLAWVTLIAMAVAGYAEAAIIFRAEVATPNRTVSHSETLDSVYDSGRFGIADTRPYTTAVALSDFDPEVARLSVSALVATSTVASAFARSQMDFTDFLNVVGDLAPGTPVVIDVAVHLRSFSPWRNGEEYSIRSAALNINEIFTAETMPRRLRIPIRTYIGAQIPLDISLSAEYRQSAYGGDVAHLAARLNWIPRQPYRDEVAIESESGMEYVPEIPEPSTVFLAGFALLIPFVAPRRGAGAWRGEPIDIQIVP